MNTSCASSTNHKPPHQPKTKLYKGRRIGELGVPIVTVNGKKLSLYREVLDLSDDFEWGYGGSGPTQLAMALIMDATGDQDLALELRHDFKREVVQWLAETWTMTNHDIHSRINRIRL